MRVAVYHSNSDLRVEEQPVPEPGPGELLVRIEASGICGSDLMEWYRLPRAPLVLGHEVAGTVERVGDGVTSFAPGDRIVTTHHVPCGDCHYCNGGRESVCETLRRTSFDPGGFAEFVRLPQINVERGTFAIPESVSFAEATFVEPLACAIRSQNIAGVGAGDCVAVLGSGISGVLQIQLARERGASTVVATDVTPWRLDAARRFGADLAVGADCDLPEEVRRINDGRLADRVIVCTGAPAAFEQALDLVDRGGSILFFAPLPPGETLELPVAEMWGKAASIVHSYAGPPAEMVEALGQIAGHRVDVESMVTHRLSLDEIGVGFRLMDQGDDCLKVIVQPHR